MGGGGGGRNWIGNGAQELRRGWPQLRTSVGGWVDR